MKRDWTFGQRIGAGFAVMAALSGVLSVVSILALERLGESKDHVINVSGRLILLAERLRAEREGKSGAARGYLLARDPEFLTELQQARRGFHDALQELRALAPTETEQRFLSAIETAEAAHQTALDRVIAARKNDAGIESVSMAFTREVDPLRDTLESHIHAFIDRRQRMLEEATRTATLAARSAEQQVFVIGGVITLLAAVLAFALARVLGRQIGTAVGRMQSSSTELQAAASQQASGSKEQATAMAEITTTINELLATARQIADSARRVAQIADQTVVAARAGEVTVEKGQEAIAGIRRQVDVIVGHMVELGKKSQRIGSVLDIVGELAEQTNILAINATIEAAGAGEAGRRFGVVADEIRKLADRVAGSTKEIRGLIEDIRAAVNTTVMTTESGSKAVDAGYRQFADVATAFRQIAAQVATTTEAAREIELSTKQQSTAVEQVNVAIANVAQATRETEASSGQTLQTASELTGLSNELLRIVQPQLT